MTSPIDPWADDCLDRKKFGNLLLACLQGESVFCDEAFVVALTGRFGSGKSYFLDMWSKHLLLKVGEEPETFPMVVTVNAWESDFSGEPLLALVSAISSQLCATRKGKEEKAVKDLKRALAGAVGVVKWTLGGLIEEKTGVPPEEVVTAFVEGASGEELDRRANALLSEFRARKQSLEKLRASLQSLIDSRSAVPAQRDLKLVLIVDELDRCHPRYAIEFLEAIKHVFNVRGMAVVLGVDWDQMCCTASAFFGQNLDTEEYFRKFVKRKVPLPIAPGEVSLKHAEKLIGRYFGAGTLNTGWWHAIEDFDRDRFLHAVFQAFRMTPRQVESAFHLLSSYYQLLQQQHSAPNRNENFLYEFFVAAAAASHPRLLQALKAQDVPKCLELMGAVSLGSRLTEARLNGEYLEGRLFGGLKNQGNSASLTGMVTAAGYTVLHPGERDPDYATFSNGFQSARSHHPAILASVAIRMSELFFLQQ